MLRVHKGKKGTPVTHVTNFRFHSACLALAIKNACPMVRTVEIKGVCFHRPWSRSMGIARYCLLKQFFHPSSMVVSPEYVQIQIHLRISHNPGFKFTTHVLSVTNIVMAVRPFVPVRPNECSYEYSNGRIHR